jgi:hypothetical protein
MANKSAGSLEPTSAGKGKWWEGIDSADLSELQALAKDINARQHDGPVKATRPLPDEGS